MIFLRYRDDPRQDAHKMQYEDTQWTEAQEDLDRLSANWKEVWMYLDLDESLTFDWVMLFDNTEDGDDHSPMG